MTVLKHVLLKGTVREGAVWNPMYLQRSVLETVQERPDRPATVVATTHVEGGQEQTQRRQAARYGQQYRSNSINVKSDCRKSIRYGSSTCLLREWVKRTCGDVFAPGQGR